MMKKLFDPTRVFISILIAIVFWIAPIGMSSEQEPVAGQIDPLIEYSVFPKLILAIAPEVSADCANKCKVQVCKKWVPIGGSCQPTHPWDIGCCTIWAAECDTSLPGCEEDPPPPVYAPPTVSSLLTCTTWGNSSWCLNNEKVALTAVDPQGFSVTINGIITLNGINTPFSCVSPCSLGMPAGSGTVTYTATAATSALSSAAGNIAFKFDPGKPVITSSTSGTQSGSWHTSPGATVTVLSNDSISGLQSVSITRNGIIVSSPFSLPEGTHNIMVTALDVAGNQATSSFTVKLDSVKPQISFDTTGISAGAWYRSATVAVAATDATSGIQILLITDNGADQSSPIALFDGMHNIFVTAADNAGNVQAASYNIQVDGTSPTIVPSIAGTTGNSDWWISNVDINAAFSDATSGVATQSFSADGGINWISLPNSILADGIHQLVFRSEDNAGNLTETTETLKIDKSLPLLSVSKMGTQGSNGWFVSDVTIKATASDITSAIASLKYQLDGGAWQAGESIVVSMDGAHVVDFVATDNAGNQVTKSESFKIDQTPPLTILAAPVPNSIAIGTVQIEGQSSDLTSGLSKTQISFDNVSWLTLPTSSDNWSYAWKTADLPNGALSIFARSIDQAGNVGTAVQTKVILDNYPPFLTLSNSWNIWESGELVVLPNITPLKNIRIVLKDPLMRYPNELLFDNLAAPSQITWDRVIGNVTAPPGSYLVEVVACDIYDVCSKTTSTIIIPEGDPIPTPEPFVFFPHAVQPPLVVPTQLVLPIQVPQAVVIPPQVNPMVVSRPSQSVWPAAVVSMLLIMFALLLLFDPRPAALRSLAKTIHPSIRSNTS